MYLFVTEISDGHFDSIGCKQVLHWIDCGFQKKVDHIVNSLRKSNCLKSNTIFFGSTAVSDTMDTGFLPRWSGRRLGESMNPKGIEPFLESLFRFATRNVSNHSSKISK